MNCSMGLNLYKVDEARGGDCINCLKCTEVCPRNNANVNILGQDVNKNLAGSVAMATMLGVYGLSNFGADALTNSGVISNKTDISSSEVIDNVASTSTSEYKDGTYTGSGIGFKGRTTKVSVTIVGGKITKIETLSYGDDRPYYEKAEDGVTKSIISKQSTSVDTVSGATFSSKGIISAVKDALSQATNSSNDTTSSETKDETSSNTAENSKTANIAEETKDAVESSKVNEGSTATASSSSNSKTQSDATTSNNQAASTASKDTTSSSSTSSQGTYKDGTYTGSGIGFKGRTTKVSVTVTGGKISNVETISYGDDRKWYERASSSVIKNIISKQSTSVDTVSGATYSSKGIMEAVKNALSQAL